MIYYNGFNLLIDLVALGLGALLYRELIEKDTLAWIHAHYLDHIKQLKDDHEADTEKRKLENLRMIEAAYTAGNKDALKGENVVELVYKDKAIDIDL